MASALAEGTILKVKVHCFGKGQWTQNVRYYIVGNMGSATYTDQNFCDALASALTTPMADCLPALAQFYGISAEIILPVPKLPVFKSVAVAGNRTTTPAPVGTSYCIHLMTQFPGREYRGRFYVPFVPVGDVGDGIVPHEAYVDKLEALAAVLRSALVLTGGANNVNVVPIVQPKTPLADKVITATRLARTFTFMESREITSDAGYVPFAPTP